MEGLNIQNRLTKMLPRLVFLFCALQPVLDIISYWADQLSIPDIFTLLLRFGFLTLMVLCGFIISRKRRIYVIFCVIIAIFLAFHILACVQNGYNSPLSDLTNMVRILCLPIGVICFISFVKANEESYSALLKGMLAALTIIILVEIISVITNTNPYTYANKEIGIIGWFRDGSTQSAILCALIPIFIYRALIRFRRNFLLQLLSVFSGSGVLYLYATRLAYLTLIITGLGFIVTVLITDKKNIRAFAALLVCTILFACLYPVSPMTRNQERVAENAVIKQNKINDLITEYNAVAVSKGLTGNELKIARLEGAYNEYMSEFVDRFGLEKVATHYNFSEKASDICDVRRMKISYCTMLMEEQGALSFIFGCEHSDMIYNNRVFDTENDLFGIFFLCGVSGLILLVCFLGFFALRIIKALLTDFKNTFTIESAAWGTSLVTILAHVWATSGVLRRPSGSIYLVFALTAVYYITSRPAKERTAK